MRPCKRNLCRQEWRKRYLADGDIEYLNRVIEALEGGRCSAIDEGPERVEKLGVCLYERYRRTGSPTDAQEAADHFRRAVDESEPADPHLPQRLARLGAALRAVYDISGSRAALKQSVIASRGAVDLESSDSEQSSRYRNGLAIALRELAAITGERADLEAAVEEARGAL